MLPASVTCGAWYSGEISVISTSTTSAAPIESGIAIPSRESQAHPREKLKLRRSVVT